MSNNNNDQAEIKSQIKKTLSEKITRQIYVSNSISPENVLTTDISITKSDLSYKQNYNQQNKSSKELSIHNYKSACKYCPRLKPRCINRVTFRDQLNNVPIASVTLIESFKRYNSQNTYDSFAPSEDSQKSNCCIII